MAEQLSNNAQTTVASGLSNLTNPVTFVVASAAAFPTAGNFRIIVDAEILLVTAVSGASFTASRAQEGTAAASHANGTAVTHVLTAGGLRQAIMETGVGFVSLAYGPTIGVPDAAAAKWFFISVTNAAAHALPNPINAIAGQMITITEFNASGGAITPMTFGANYRVGGYVQPSAGFMTSACFVTQGTLWYQATPWSPGIAA